MTLTQMLIQDNSPLKAPTAGLDSRSEPKTKEKDWS